MTELTRLEHSDIIMKVGVKKWLVVREDFTLDTIGKLKRGTRLRIYERGQNHIWCHDEECATYAIGRQHMWYLEPETVTK